MCSASFGLVFLVTAFLRPRVACLKPCCTLPLLLLSLDMFVVIEWCGRCCGGVVLVNVSVVTRFVVVTCLDVFNEPTGT